MQADPPRSLAGPILEEHLLNHIPAASLQLAPGDRSSQRQASQHHRHLRQPSHEHCVPSPLLYSRDYLLVQSARHPRTRSHRTPTHWNFLAGVVSSGGCRGGFAFRPRAGEDPRAQEHGFGWTLRDALATISDGENGRWSSGEIAWCGRVVGPEEVPKRYWGSHPLGDDSRFYCRRCETLKARSGEECFSMAVTWNLAWSLVGRQSRIDNWRKTNLPYDQGSELLD